MRLTWMHAAGLVALALAGAAVAGTGEGTKSTGAAGSTAGEAHQAMNRGELKWGPAPEALPPGAKAAVLEGDPAAEGKMFTVRLKAPKGYVVPPHSHPTTEHVTVISGSFAIGEGDKVDKKSAKVLKPGGFAAIPEGHHHFAMALEPDTEVQVHAMGPFQITYVNPADDPRAKKAASAR